MAPFVLPLAEWASGICLFCTIWPGMDYRPPALRELEAVCFVAGGDVGTWIEQPGLLQWATDGKTALPVPQAGEDRRFRSDRAGAGSDVAAIASTAPQRG
jgi:hypothetical protein